MPTVLSVGNGFDPLPQWVEQGYSVVRVDIDPATEPDIVGSMTALGDIGPYDVVYCSHALEHVYPHAHVRLHFFISRHWQGEALALEGQQLAWQGSVAVEPLLPATIPLLEWLDRLRYGDMAA